ncbi:MAG: hypothetical protein ALAOOOJD_03492 [bacterium]|nr:hypothetical protein [bacterium]
MEMRIFRHVLHDAGHFEIMAILITQGFTHGAFGAKIFMGQRCGEHDGERFGQRRLWIAFQ